MIGAKPGDTRGFVHKKIFKAAKGLASGLVGGIPVVGPVAQQIGRGVGIFPGGPPMPVSLAPRRGFGGIPEGAQGIVLPPNVPGEGSGCRPRESVRCCNLRNGSIADQAEWQRTCGTSGEAQPQFGGAEMGQFGAGLQPATFQTTTRVCPRGAVLGMDGLCYNKRDIRNSERMWPRGTRPLLTGGEMRCIRIASSASNKLRRKQKQLEKMGMLPKPTRRAAPRAIAPGHHVHAAHD